MINLEALAKHPGPWTTRQVRYLSGWSWLIEDANGERIADVGAESMARIIVDEHNAMEAMRKHGIGAIRYTLPNGKKWLENKL